jgi:hypothetical protein
MGWWSARWARVAEARPAANNGPWFRQAQCLGRGDCEDGRTACVARVITRLPAVPVKEEVNVNAVEACAWRTKKNVCGGQRRMCVLSGSPRWLRLHRCLVVGFARCRLAGFVMYCSILLLSCYTIV